MTVIARPTGALILIGSFITALVAVAAPASADTYVPISGAGSTWSENALQQWIKNVDQYGLRVNYSGTGSSDGRNQFKNRTVDFAVSEIPYGLSDGGVVDQPPSRPYAYMPIVAGGTSFMYNLKVGNARVANLRLSGETIAKIFTGVITSWDDPAIKAENPSLALPARKVVPVVRSDGSGTTAQLTTWLSKTYPNLWNDYCARAGKSVPCGITSFYPVAPGSGFTAQAQSNGVAGYVKQGQNEGTITYVEYSYALNAGFPVAKMLNKAGYFIEPKASNVAVGLLGASINNDPNSPAYLTQQLDGVYNNPDPRAYPLSSYSYMVVPTDISGNFTADKGKTLGAFSYYFLCEGQQQAEDLGYSPLPINLVQAGLEQVKRIKGVVQENVNIAQCNNPTFSPDGTNTLAKNAPQPAECDKQGPTQCAAGSNKAAPPAAGGQAANAASAAAAGKKAAASSTAATGTAADPAAATTTTEALIDPDTGEVLYGEESGATNVAAIPVSLTSQSGWTTQQTLMVMAGALLIAVTIGPALLARALALRRDR